MNGSRCKWLRRVSAPSRKFMHIVATCIHVVAACSLLAVTAQPAWGATLAELVGGDFIDAGLIRFSDWELVTLDSTAVLPPDLTLISVQPISDDPSNSGFQFVANGQLSTTGLNSIDLELKFRVSALGSGNSLVGQALELTGVNVAATGGISFVSAGIADENGADLLTALVIADNLSNVFQFLDSATFPQQSQIFASMNVFVTGLSETDSAGLNSFTQTFHLVPEPSSFPLALMAIFAFIRPRRRI